MIHELRVRHFRTVTALAVLVPAGVAAGLLARAPVPRPDALPDALAPAVAVAAWEWRRADLWPGLAVSTALGRAPDGAIVVELLARTDPARPDPLVYWTAGTAPTGALAPDAVLLGTLAGTEPRRFRLPAAAAAGPGRLVLYSLAHAEVFGETPFPEAR